MLIMCSQYLMAGTLGSDRFSDGKSAKNDNDVIYLGVVSPRGFENTYSRYLPLSDHLSKKTGKTFKIVPLAHKNNLPYLRDGKIDFLLTNPTIAASVIKLTDAKLIANLHKHSGYQFGGVIFAKKNTGITKLSDLSGKRVLAYKIGRSAGGYIFQTYHMKQKGTVKLSDFKWLREAKTQDFVVEAVIRGHADVGFIRTGILEMMEDEGKINIADLSIIDQVNNPNFKKVLSTDLYPEWYLISGSHVSTDLVEETTEVALSIKADMDVSKLSNIRGFVKPLPLTPLIDVLTSLQIPPFDR